MSCLRPIFTFTFCITFISHLKSHSIKYVKNTDFLFYRFNIEGKSCTLEFIDALQTVLLNGRPLQVEFGGLPKPVFVQGKKHFIRFSVLPRGFRAGYVNIKNMKGEQPKETSSDCDMKTLSEVSNSSVAVASPLLVEPDSTSQDGIDHSYSSKSGMLKSLKCKFCFS
jgi:pre-mRNA cleavage complex 2 protein Pcf11